MGLKIAPKTKYYLAQMGIFTQSQVLSHLPRRYDIFLYTDPKKLLHLQDKEKVVLYGVVVGQIRTLRFPKATSTQFYFRPDSGPEFKVVAWNRPYLGKLLQEYGRFTLRGSYDASRHELNFLSAKKGRIEEKDAFVPVYSLPDGFQEHLFRDLVRKCFENFDGDSLGVVPASLMQKYRLLGKKDALYRCHFPSCEEDIHQGRRALKYEEGLLFCLKNALIRKANSIPSSTDKGAIDRIKLREFVRSLPYELTSSQKNAIAECLNDMEGKSLMYRLLQGDVGSGKTLVASLLLYANASRGSQGALMAPTETLAKQHYKYLSDLFSSTPFKVVLLLGESKGEERRKTLQEISNGEASIVVGTHALFSSSVHYARLGLAIIDEQHKFGVNQRALLQEKGDSCDLLLMSATPIPRTLSLSVYGDLEVSTLTEFPGGERKIITKEMELNARTPFVQAKKSISRGHQVYVVAPQIEGEGYASVEKIYDLYEMEFPGCVALLHGGMDTVRKEKAIADFASFATPILVATSVVEVGIDVKTANLMIIYEASHFALSSLHQLRGRIGRGGEEGLCLLLDHIKQDEAKEKLDVICSTQDGFKIAEEDLRLRGPGTWAGVKQSGLPDFLYLNLLEDGTLLSYARKDAHEILQNDEKEEYRKLLALAKKSLEDISLA